MTEEYILGAGLLKLPGIDLEEIQSTKKLMEKLNFLRKNQNSVTKQNDDTVKVWPRDVELEFDSKGQEMICI